MQACVCIFLLARRLFAILALFVLWITTLAFTASLRDAVAKFYRLLNCRLSLITQASQTLVASLNLIIHIMVVLWVVVVIVIVCVLILLELLILKVLHLG